MSFSSVTLLVCIVLTSLLLLMNTDQTSAQTNQVATANSDIIAAFHSIQMAEQQGASSSDLLPLINQLNAALQYEEEATRVQPQNATLANFYANQSIAVSTNVSTRAAQLGGEAHSESLQRSMLAYAASLLVAGLAALAIVETPRLKRYLSTRKTRKARIVYGGHGHEQ